MYMQHRPININKLHSLSGRKDCYLDIQAISLDQYGLFIGVNDELHQVCDDEGQFIYTDSLRAMEQLIQDAAHLKSIKTYLEEPEGLDYHLYNGRHANKSMHSLNI